MIVHVVPLVLSLILAAGVIWLIQTAPLPIHPWIRNIISFILFFALLIYLLGSFGIETGIRTRFH